MRIPFIIYTEEPNHSECNELGYMWLLDSNLDDGRLDF